MTMFEDPQTNQLRSPVYGVITGQFVGVNQNRQPLVVFPGQSGSTAVAARSIIKLTGISFGAEVLLQFDQGDIDKPIILGALQDQAQWTEQIDGQQLDIDADGERLQIQAKEQIVLRCGEASITLTRSGKVLINGIYLSSRAKGTHRIKGGNVQIN